MRRDWFVAPTACPFHIDLFCEIRCARSACTRMFFGLVGLFHREPCGQVRLAAGYFAILCSPANRKRISGNNRCLKKPSACREVLRMSLVRTLPVFLCLVVVACSSPSPAAAPTQAAPAATSVSATVAAVAPTVQALAPTVAAAAKPAATAVAQAAPTVAAAAASAATAVAKPAANAAPVTITFWHGMNGTDPGTQGGALQELVNQYKQVAPNVTINLDFTPYTGNELEQKVTAGIAARNTPDLVQAFESDVAAWYDAGAIAPLDDYAKNSLTDADMNDIQKALLDSGRFPQYNNQLLSFPFNRSIYVIYYNKPELTKAGFPNGPKTWDDLQAACAKIV